jgi:hypothetical protein
MVVVDTGMEVTRMVYFKACPRCSGDMHGSSDMYGSYKECLQCGHVVDLEKRSILTEVIARDCKVKAA